jgi:hypothetical protein
LPNDLDPGRRGLAAFGARRGGLTGGDGDLPRASGSKGWKPWSPKAWSGFLRAEPLSRRRLCLWVAGPAIELRQRLALTPRFVRVHGLKALAAGGTLPVS